MFSGLKFIADEGVEKGIVLAIRERYEVLFVAETMRSTDDDNILEKAESENRILITLDKDFGELVFRSQQKHAGVILCRLQGLPTPEKAALVKSIIDKYGEELLNAFTVIQPNNIRIRKL